MSNLALLTREMTIGDPATTPTIASSDGTCHWLNLPKELRDRIFRDVYGRPDEPLNLKFKGDFKRVQNIEKCECEEDERLFVPRRFKPYITRFFVNRYFAFEAAEAFFATTELRLTNMHSHNIFALSRSSDTRMLGFEFLSSVHIDFSDLRRLAPLFANTCPRLQHLRVTCTSEQLRRCHCDSYPLIEYETRKLRILEWLAEIDCLSGLRTAVLEMDLSSCGPIGGPQAILDLQHVHERMQALFEWTLTRKREEPRPWEVPPPRHIMRVCKKQNSMREKRAAVRVEQSTAVLSPPSVPRSEEDDPGRNKSDKDLIALWEIALRRLDSGNAAL